MTIRAKALIALAALAFSAGAYADASSASRAFFQNMARVQMRLVGFDQNSVRAVPTPATGLYVLLANDGNSTYINEAGTLYLTPDGFKTIDLQQRKSRLLSGEERAELMAEVLAAIDYSKLVKIQYGNGGGRKILLFSAIDCPHCEAMEASLRRNGGRLNTTLYVVPSSLQSLAQGGRARWEAVGRIWCAEALGKAWNAFWATKVLPSVRLPSGCEFADPVMADANSDTLYSTLKRLNPEITGVPSALREDGARIPLRDEMSAEYLATHLGPAGVVAAREVPAKWLAPPVAAVATEAQSGEAAGSAPPAASAQGQVPQAVNPLLELRKLFGR